MQRLGRTDVRFLELETTRRPMHTLKIAVLRPSPEANFETLRASIVSRLDRVPTMRLRLANPPLGLGRPAWVEDAGFDVDRHLTEMSVAPPGGHRELCDLVARAAEAPLLDRAHPLWEMWVADGLTEGRLAVIARVHHAFADGVSFARILAGWFAEEEPGPAAAEEPDRAGRWMRSHVAGAGKSAGDFAAFARATRSARRSRQPDVPPAPFSGRRLGAERRFGCQALSMDAIHSARKPLGATVNDLLIAIVASALGDHLRERGALPDSPLVATMPVSLLPAAEHGPIGNRGLATTKVVLPTDVGEAVERVRVASAAAKRAKDDLAATAGARLDDAVDLLPRAAIRAAAGLLDSGRLAALGNLSISNVRGPSQPLAADGLEVEDFFSVGPCAPGAGLNITAWSYADRFNVAMLADPATGTDPWDILERLPRALEDLGAPAGRG